MSFSRAVVTKSSPPNLLFIVLVGLAALSARPALLYGQTSCTQGNLPSWFSRPGVDTRHAIGYGSRYTFLAEAGLKKAQEDATRGAAWIGPFRIEASKNFGEKQSGGINPMGERFEHDPTGNTAVVDTVLQSFACDDLLVVQSPLSRPIRTAGRKIDVTYVLDRTSNLPVDLQLAEIKARLEASYTANTQVREMTMRVGQRSLEITQHNTNAIFSACITTRREITERTVNIAVSCYLAGS
jgi:hypothetical protein